MGWWFTESAFTGESPPPEVEMARVPRGTERSQESFNPARRHWGRYGLHPQRAPFLRPLSLSGDPPDTCDPASYGYLPMRISKS